jgi:hypothetical protein
MMLTSKLKGDQLIFESDSPMHKVVCLACTELAACMTLAQAGNFLIAK